jgi:hypothetical protein
VNPLGRIAQHFGRPNDGKSFPLVLFTSSHDASFPATQYVVFDTKARQRFGSETGVIFSQRSMMVPPRAAADGLIDF